MKNECIVISVCKQKGGVPKRNYTCEGDGGESRCQNKAGS